MSWSSTTTPGTFLWMSVVFAVVFFVKMIFFAPCSSSLAFSSWCSASHQWLANAFFTGFGHAGWTCFSVLRMAWSGGSFNMGLPCLVLPAFFIMRRHAIHLPNDDCSFFWFCIVRIGPFAPLDTCHCGLFRLMKNVITICLFKITCCLFELLAQCTIKINKIFGI